MAMDPYKILEADQVDVLIIGAGISGINTAYHVQTQLPDSTYAIIEARGNIGGTWDFFKFPGIRSDSDLHTFGFAWNPWTENTLIADGASILAYMEETVRKHGIDRHILFNHGVISANWSSDAQMWKVSVEGSDGQRQLNAKFIVFGTGYYDYANPLETTIPGLENFQGQVIHPQSWPQDLDYTDKRIVVIGSGATAITLLPVLSETASRVTMLQRSPSYVLSVPQPASSAWMRSLFPQRFVLGLARLQFLFIPYLFSVLCHYLPGVARSFLRGQTIRQLPDNIPHDPHFKPAYNPWEQRLCMCPEGDFFKALRSGKADVATGKIDTVTEHGITLESGQLLDADIIVTATGLKLKIIGGVKISVDGTRISLPDKFLWRYCMLQDVPNCFTVTGYTNTSWTLGAETAANVITRVMKYTKSHQMTSAIPRLEHPETMKVESTFPLSSTYIQRGLHQLPKVGAKGPWKGRSNYFVDYWNARFGDINTGMEYSRVSS